MPNSDALFIAETNPALAGLEDPSALRSRGLILENVDGFSKPGVLRSVPHTFALQTSLGPENALAPFPNGPPDQRLGWGGDGAPGLRRRPGTDFRIPTQAETDAIEAFQLFTGRQKFVDATALTLRDTRAQHGRQLFLSVNSGGKCTNCHFDMGQIIARANADVDRPAFMDKRPGLAGSRKGRLVHGEPERRVLTRATGRGAPTTRHDPVDAPGAAERIDRDRDVTR